MADERLPADGIPRRKMLKRIGAAGAIAWATPVISSLNTPAFAAGTQPTVTCDDCSAACLGQVLCGEACGCLETTEGRCFCHEASVCSELQSCSTSGDCLPGWACANSCCDGPRCLPPCGIAERRARVPGVPMTIPG